MKGKVAVIGLGYVGLPLAISAAKTGWNVVGVDISTTKVQGLLSGISHVHEVSGDEVVSLIQNGKFKPVSSYDEVLGSSIFVICVPTPLDANNQPDLSLLESSLKSLAPFLSDNALLINESTSFPGTLREFIGPMILKNVPEKVKNLKFAVAPERIDPGNRTWSIVDTPRLVSGLTQTASEMACDFYQTFCEQVIQVSSPEVAEFAKLLENTFRQVNIALVNQLVPIARALEVDIREVIQAASSKPYGFMPFYPGAGVGGHCIPVDPSYLLWKAKELGLGVSFIELANKVNQDMPRLVADILIRDANLKRGDKVLIMGVAYKPGVADTRESPAYGVMTRFINLGMDVLWFDPLVEYFELGRTWDRKEYPEAAIVITAQPGLPVQDLISTKIPILDCTGFFKGLEGVSQL